jgi:glycosyltransferase
VRRHIYEKCGLFNTTLRSAADYELMLRVLVKFNAHATYIPEVLVKMRAGGMSNASFKNRIKANKEDEMAWKLNNLKPYFFTTWLKPLRKVFQFNPINIWRK